MQTETPAAVDIVLISKERGAVSTDKPLTCTRADSEAHPLLGAVKGHIEALHHRGADHQATGRRRDAKSEAVQCTFHIGDWLNVQLQRANGSAALQTKVKTM